MAINHSPYNSQFERLSDDISRQSDIEQCPLLSEKSSTDNILPYLQENRRREQCWSSSRNITIVNALLFAASVALFISLPFRRPTSLNADLKRVSAYSPVLETGHIPLIDVQVSGALFPATDGSDGLGRREPGPETDKLWTDFEYQRKFAVSSDTIRKLGKDPAKTIKYPSEYGLGDDAYMVALDSFHQIHCLNLLRKEAFKDYYFDGEQYHEEMYSSSAQHEGVHSEFFWIHLRHCTDMILQTLMCHADTEMISMTWMETQENPWPDFNVNKKCKSFDALKEWRDQHAEPWSKVSQLKKPFDLVHVDEQYALLFGNTTIQGDNVHHPVW